MFSCLVADFCSWTRSSFHHQRAQCRGDSSNQLEWFQRFCCLLLWLGFLVQSFCLLLSYQWKSFPLLIHRFSRQVFLQHYLFWLLFIGNLRKFRPYGRRHHLGLQSHLRSFFGYFFETALLGFIFDTPSTWSPALPPLLPPYSTGSNPKPHFQFTHLISSSPFLFVIVCYEGLSFFNLKFNYNIKKI